MVTVVLPLDSQPIKIGKQSFFHCRTLANLELSRKSSAEEDSFEEYDKVHRSYGADSSRVVAG